MTRAVLVLMGGLLVLAAAPVFAQQALTPYAFASKFDGNAPVVLTGQLLKWEPGRPYGYLVIKGQTTSAPGQPVVPDDHIWHVETTTPEVMRGACRGETYRTITEGVGLVVTVRGYYAKDRTCGAACVINGRDVAFPDGRKFFLGSSSGCLG